MRVVRPLSNFRLDSYHQPVTSLSARFPRRVLGTLGIVAPVVRNGGRCGVLSIIGWLAGQLARRRDALSELHLICLAI